MSQVKIVALVNSVVNSIHSVEVDMVEGAVPLIVSDKVDVNISDVYSKGAFTQDPDAEKKALLEAEKKKAIAALQGADDKAEILKALTDATAAVQPLEDVVKP